MQTSSKQLDSRRRRAGDLGCEPPAGSPRRVKAVRASKKAGCAVGQDDAGSAATAAASPAAVQMIRAAYADDYAL